MTTSQVSKLPDFVQFGRVNHVRSRYAMALSVVQAFAPESARQLHAVPLPLVAMCLTIYMVCGAGGHGAGRLFG